MPPKQQEVIAKLNDILKRIEAIEDKIEKHANDKEYTEEIPNDSRVASTARREILDMGESIKSRIRTVY